MNMVISEILPSTFEVIPKFINKIIEQLKKEYPLTDEDVFPIRLALDEGLANAVKHGNKFNETLSVRANVVTQNDELIIDIKDQGQGFDFVHVPDPTAQDKLMKTSGRGVFLMRKIMDQVEYYDGGRGLRMVKKLK
jgi:serine/threonine-protein kinase RsbW